MEVLGELAVLKFQKKHPQSRKPLARFLQIARMAEWRNLVELKETLPSADYVATTGVIVFNIAGNKYRLTATVNFARQRFSVEAVMTHEEYNRREL